MKSIVEMLFKLNFKKLRKKSYPYICREKTHDDNPQKVDKFN